MLTRNTISCILNVLIPSRRRLPTPAKVTLNLPTGKVVNADCFVFDGEAHTSIRCDELALTCKQSYKGGGSAGYGP